MIWNISKIIFFVLKSYKCTFLLTSTIVNTSYSKKLQIHTWQCTFTLNGHVLKGNGVYQPQDWGRLWFVVRVSLRLSKPGLSRSRKNHALILRLIILIITLGFSAVPSPHLSLLSSNHFYDCHHPLPFCLCFYYISHSFRMGRIECCASGIKKFNCSVRRTNRILPNYFRAFYFNFFEVCTWFLLI